MVLKLHATSNTIVKNVIEHKLNKLLREPINLTIFILITYLANQ
jgi:hypothetical protein